MQNTGRLSGRQIEQYVKDNHSAITTAAADLVSPSKVPRDILIQNNDLSGTIYLFLTTHRYMGLRYTSGGTTEIVAGNTITGATGGATAEVEKVVLDSGSWAGGDAVGVLIIKNIVGTFQSENLNVSINGVATNLATIAADAFRCDSAGDYNAAHMSLRFTSGGTTAIKVGDTITGETGGATAVVKAVTLDSGTWAGGDAAGVLSIDTISGTFEAETLKVGASLNLANIAADAYSKGMFVVFPGGGSFEAAGTLNGISALGNVASNENVAVSEGS